jgi:sugar phosphate isomerase/epimerase
LLAHLLEEYASKLAAARKHMQFGICTSIENSALMKSQGWDFVEENCQNILQREQNDSKLPVLAANVLVPGSIKLTGPTVDNAAIDAHLNRVIERAKAYGIKKIVFGSGGARNVPDGFDREEARFQIRLFLEQFIICTVRRSPGITLCVEHLRRAESNIINTIDEAMCYVRAGDGKIVQCLLDAYHLWSESESFDHVREAMPWIKHVHLADLENRVAPGLSGKSDYRPIFSILREGGYDGLISVEALQFDIAKDGERVLAFVRDQWENA